MRSTDWARHLVAGLGTLLVGALFVAPRAHAHAGEFLRSLVLHPTDPNVFALRYEGALGGLLFSHDGGRSLRVVPGQTFYGYDLRRHVPMLMGGDGKLQIALDDELHVDDGTGCALRHVERGIARTDITALAHHPSDPMTAFAVTRSGSAADASSHLGLWRRDAQGMTPIGASDPLGTMQGLPPFHPTSLKVVARAASVEGLRFIEGGVTTDYATTPPTSTMVLRVSDDLGMTWTTHPIPGNGVVGNPRLLLVSGSDPFRALVALEQGLGEPDGGGEEPNDPIVLTSDSAHSFRPYLNEIQVAGEAVLLPSGRVLLGDRGIPGGLWSATDIEATPTKIQDLRVHCLAYQATTQKLFMCTRHELGLFDLASESFCAMFRMTDTRGFVSCPSAPLEQNSRAKDQVCRGFCTALHYATAPLCSSFDTAGAALCGAAALAYDTEASYVAPPGPDAAPRCSGFSALVDAGVDGGGEAGVDADATSEADAGADAEVDVDVDGGRAATEPLPTRDAEADEESDEEPGEEPDEEPDAGMMRKKRRGCACDLAGPKEPKGLAWLAALTLGLALRVRARRVARG